MKRGLNPCRLRPFVIHSSFRNGVPVQNEHGFRFGLPGTFNETQLVKLLEHIAEHAKLYKIILTSRRTPIFTDRMLRLLSRSVTARIERMRTEPFFAAAGIQKDIAIWYGASALIGTIVAWLKKDMPYTPSFLAKQFTLMRSYLKL